MTYYPGLFGDRRRERFWPLLLASAILHAGLFFLFSRFQIRPADRGLDAPIQMVELGGDLGGPRGGGPKGRGPEKLAPVEEPAVEKPAEPEPPPAARIPEPKAKPEPRPEPPAARIPEPKAPPPAPRPAPAPKPEPDAVAIPKTSPPPKVEPPRAAPRERTEEDVAQAVARMRAKQTGDGEDRIAQRVAQLRAKQASPEAAVSEKVARMRERLIQGSEAQVEQRVAALREKYGTREPGRGGSATGTGGGGSLGVSGGGGPGLQGFLEGRYVEGIKNHLNQFWSVPETLKGKGYEAFVTVIVDRRGKIVNWGLRHSTSRLFDERVERAVAEADPLPAVPSGMSGDRFEFELRFSAP